MRYTDELRKHIKGKWCVYCGELSTTKEHFPPATYSRTGWLLPCCAECNSLAGTSYPVNFIERTALVKDKINKRFNEPFIPHLVEELYEMEDIEWQHMIDDLEKVRRHRRRLAWSAKRYLLLIGALNVFVEEYAETNTITMNAPRHSEPIEEIKNRKLTGKGSSWPSEGTICAQIWNTASNLIQQTGKPPSPATLAKSFPELNKATIKTQHRYWKRFIENKT